MITRTHIEDNEVVEVTVTPARLRDRNGRDCVRYPAEREYLVDQAILRRCNEYNPNEENEVTRASFTTGDIVMELARQGTCTTFPKLTKRSKSLAAHM
jgi:hypothetical protein